ncbi:hypothetical protein P3472_21300, partial [Vibrio parahaemolyticus]|nr:hypothetical protein [Vibrio parahaemolyticus]
IELAYAIALNISRYNAHCNSGSCGLAITKANSAQVIEILYNPSLSNFWAIHSHATSIYGL